jgi:hypothetical protein
MQVKANAKLRRTLIVAHERSARPSGIPRLQIKIPIAWVSGGDEYTIFGTTRIGAPYADPSGATLQTAGCPF